MHDDCKTECDEAPCCRKCFWFGYCPGTCRLAILLEQASGLEEEREIESRIS
jgi:sulfatase maturation enzyme AslB (radical SAM superfamily)